MAPRSRKEPTADGEEQGRQQQEQETAQEEHPSKERESAMSAAAGGSSRRGPRAITDAAQAYFGQLRETLGRGEAQQRVEEAYRDCLRAVTEQELPDEEVQRLTQAYSKVARTLQEEFSRPLDAGAGTQEAYQEYNELLRGVLTERQERAEAARDYYVQTLREAPKQVYDLVQDAYAAYIAALQSAWTDMDVEELGADRLLAAAADVAAVASAHLALTRTIEQAAASAAAQAKLVEGTA